MAFGCLDAPLPAGHHPLPNWQVHVLSRRSGKPKRTVFSNVSWHANQHLNANRRHLLISTKKPRITIPQARLGLDHAGPEMTKEDKAMYVGELVLLPKVSYQAQHLDVVDNPLFTCCERFSMSFCVQHCLNLVYRKGSCFSSTSPKLPFQSPKFDHKFHGSTAHTQNQIQKKAG